MTIDIKKLRDDSVNEYHELIARSRDRKKPRLTLTEVEKRDARLKELKTLYFENLPIVTLSQCPFCQVSFQSYFDPWGVDGFWWQEKELTVSLPKIENCKHFVLLQGALNLNDNPPKGGLSPAHTGPEMPFVVPKLFDLPTMKMVVSRFQLENGYQAYPLVYYAKEKPKPGKLMEAWRFQTYSWTSEDGHSSWNISSAPWDFDLTKWVDKHNVGWIEDTLSANRPEGKLNVIFERYSEYPFTDVSGRMARLEIKQDWLNENELPNGNEGNPFE